MMVIFSALSFCACTSFLSMFSVNSILSVGSVNSVLSVGCVNSIMCIGGKSYLDDEEEDKDDIVAVCYFKNYTCASCVEQHKDPFCTETCESFCSVNYGIGKDGRVFSLFSSLNDPCDCENKNKGKVVREGLFYMGEESYNYSLNGIMSPNWQTFEGDLTIHRKSACKAQYVCEKVYPDKCLELGYSGWGKDGDCCSLMEEGKCVDGYHFLRSNNICYLTDEFTAYDAYCTKT